MNSMNLATPITELPDLTQRRLFQRRAYQIHKDGVRVTEKSVFHSRSYHACFENIAPKQQQFTQCSANVFKTAIIVTVLALITVWFLLAQRNRDGSDVGVILFWVGATTLCWWSFFTRRASFIVYSYKGSGLTLYAKRPSQDAVANFIQKVFVARNRYLRARYGQFSPGQPPPEKLNRLNYLRNLEAITEDEYQQLRLHHVDCPRSSSGPIGFAAARTMEAARVN